MSDLYDGVHPDGWEELSSAAPTEDTPTPDDYWANHTCTTACSHIRPENLQLKHDDTQLREAIAEIVHYLTDDSDLLSSGIRGTIDRLYALFTTAQIQLVSELEGHSLVVPSPRQTPGIPAVVEVVPLSVLEHKKQELERLQ